MDFSSGEQGSCVGLSNGGGAGMPWAAEYVPARATVVVNSSGRLRFEDMRGIAKRATDLLQKNKASRVLIDCSEAILDVKVIDIFYLPECYERVGVPRDARIAFVVPKTRQPLGICEFYETVCRNKGYLCRLFDTQESAMQWLR
ncbi:MAG: hypothetical protein JW753_11715 [Dehalococcoidia bacterium]|nr:hypothetical protein [Dehalococcoidia bacterium]